MPMARARVPVDPRDVANAVKPYATTTGTRRNIEAMRAHGFGLLLTPDAPWLHNGFTIALDNGAFGAWQRGTRWQPEPWLDLLDKHGEQARWAVLPDIVHGGRESLAQSLEWLQRVRNRTALWLIAVQDGMTSKDVSPHVNQTVGLFVGGSSEWKEQTLPTWGKLAKRRGCYLHVGRVNTARRIRLCAMAGADSFDGTSATRFSKNTPRIAAAAAQGAFPWDQ